jgi:exopolyphosphatase/pppGpp-phosphohydrolase
LSGRVSLRQLLTHAANCSREAIGQLREGLLPSLYELRQLSRAVRHPSAYPTADALARAVQRLLEAAREVRKVAEALYQQLYDIRLHSRRQQKERRQRRGKEERKK